jgi:hypothetical protein
MGECILMAELQFFRDLSAGLGMSLIEEKRVYDEVVR